MNEARIKLTEAMGIEPYIHKKDFSYQRFDPFTSADDDYAVLEWVRLSITRGKSGVLLWADSDDWWRFYAQIKLIGPEYQIGDYARAVCKVLELSQ